MVAALLAMLSFGSPPKTPLTALAVPLCNQVMAKMGHQEVFNLSMMPTEYVDAWLVSRPDVPLVCSRAQPREAAVLRYRWPNALVDRC